MAGGKGHLIGGFIFILVLLHTITHYFYRPSLLDLVMYIAIGLMFAVCPDVDIKSIGQKFFYTVFFLVDLFLFYFYFFRRSTASQIKNQKQNRAIETTQDANDSRFRFHRSSQSLL